jgi:hypothetical protein
MAVDFVNRFKVLGQMQLNTALFSQWLARRSAWAALNATATYLLADFRHVLLNLGFGIHRKSPLSNGILTRALSPIPFAKSLAIGAPFTSLLSVTKLWHADCFTQSPRELGQATFLHMSRASISEETRF